MLTTHKHLTDNFSSLKQSLPLCANSIGENISDFYAVFANSPLPRAPGEVQKKKQCCVINAVITPSDYQAIKDNIFTFKRD